MEQSAKWKKKLATWKKTEQEHKDFKKNQNVKNGKLSELNKRKNLSGKYHP